MNPYEDVIIEKIIIDYADIICSSGTETPDDPNPYDFFYDYDDDL